ncbi:hypothetical protein, partial [Neisseria gonorrhoeae]
MAYFELETTNTGIGKVKITASSGNEKATYEVEMDVYNPNPITYAIQNVVLSAGESQKLSTQPLGNDGRYTLEVSS